MRNDLAELRNLISLQMLYRPSRQSAHCPQGCPTSSATLSPTWSEVTPDPTAVTIPADSWPSVRGSRHRMVAAVAEVVEVMQIRAAQAGGLDGDLNLIGVEIRKLSLLLAAW